MSRTPRIRRDDTVTIIAGKDRGKTGKVLRVDPKRQRVWVQGLNMVKRHERPQQVRQTTKGGMVGGVIEKEASLHLSNVMLVDPKGDRPTRVTVVREDGRRVRVARRSGTRFE